MSERSLRDTLAELEAALQDRALDPQERARLLSLHAQLESALRQPHAAPGGLRSELDAALARAEGDHPRLTGVLSRLLDTLSEIGL
jgi:Domain of unknown function (DUF4404)